jgi:hypothetical protein
MEANARHDAFCSQYLSDAAGMPLVWNLNHVLEMLSVLLHLLGEGGSGQDGESTDRQVFAGIS